MKAYLTHCPQLWSLVLLMLCAWLPAAQADPVPVRYARGTLHGLLQMRSEDGSIVAAGDMVQVVHGSRVTTRLTFHFKDGSIDDETTIYSQRGHFRLISDHHIQKGPTFPHPIDFMVDCQTGKVTVHSTGKDGKDEVKTSSPKLQPDLSNGLVSTIIENLAPNGDETKVSMAAATPDVRLVTLSIMSHGEEPFSVAGAPRKAIRYEIKIDLGGVAGVIAPLIGKQPPSIQVWIVGGQAPTFIREEGPIYPEGPVYTIELANATWPEPPHPSK